MKSIIFVLVSLLGSLSFATHDVLGEVTIVVEDYNSESGYSLKTVPTDYCVGIESYSLATAITQPVTIKTNYGCGTPAFDKQINEAVCAKVNVNEVNNPDGSHNHRTVSIDLDLSGCGAKASDFHFVRVLTDAIYKSYNDQGLQIVRFSK